MLIVQTLTRWSMVETLGVVVLRDAIDACVIRGSSVRWSGSTSLGESGAFEPALRDLLRSIPSRFVLRRRSRVMLSSGRAPVKVLPGVLASTAEDSPDAVRSNPERFFLNPSGTIVMSELWISPSGDVWGAAFREDDLEILQRVLGSRGWGTPIVVPDDGKLEPADPRTAAQPGVGQESQSLPLPAHALAARQSVMRLRATLTQEKQGSTGSRVSHVLAVYAAAAIGAFLAFDWGAYRLQLRALDRDAVAFRAVSDLRDSLEALLRDEARFKSFNTAYPSLLLRLHALTRTIDSLGRFERIAFRDSIVELTLMSRDAIHLAARLDRLPFVQEVRILGSVQRDQALDVPDRVTLRLRVAAGETDVAGTANAADPHGAAR